MKIDRLVTHCTPQGMDTWAITHPAMLAHIAAERFELIVPDAALAQFRAATDPRFDVVPASRYLGDTTLDAITARLAPARQHRVADYVAQFLQLAALLQADEQAATLLWASDALPLKPLTWADADGRLLYYRGQAADAATYRCLQRIAGLAPVNAEGFDARCAPVKGAWVRGLCQHIEQTTGAPWIAGILTDLEGDPQAEFSVYECLGTWAFVAQADAVRLAAGRGFRYGMGLYGAAARLDAATAARLCLDIDYICFEANDTRPFRGLQIGTGNHRIDETIFNNRMLNTDIELFPTVEMTLDITQLPWYIRSRSLEQVTCNSIIEHIDDVLGLFKEIDRCLLPGGLIVFAVPFIGSYNHGTDITHKRGFTFDSFNFLVNDRSNYLYRYPERRIFDYKPLMFWREDVVNGELVHERLGRIPTREESIAWTERVMRHEIPGSFGFIFQKAGGKETA